MFYQFHYTILTRQLTRVTVAKGPSLPVPHRNRPYPGQDSDRLVWLFRCILYPRLRLVRHPRRQCTLEHPRSPSPLRQTVRDSPHLPQRPQVISYHPLHRLHPRRPGLSARSCRCLVVPGRKHQPRLQGHERCSHLPHPILRKHRCYGGPFLLVLLFLDSLPDPASCWFDWHRCLLEWQQGSG